MTKRTPEEIRAQREAVMAARAARAAGLDVPPAPPPASQPAEKPAEAPAPAPAPAAPGQKRTPEEIKAQRDAMLAARAARAAGAPAPAPAPVAVAEAPAPVAVAAAPAAAAPAAKPAPKPKEVKPASAPAAETAPAVDPNLTRREFLNYAWLASIGLFALEAVGLSLWFAFPNFKEGQFGGTFPIGDASGALPEVNSGPKAYTEGKFWLVNLDTKGPGGEPRKGIMAIYKVCTHLGCLYEWVPMTNRFECPCHGSKFALTGDYLAGPARRSLDRFVIQAIAADGSIKETDADGNPLVIDGTEKLVIDTGRRILGKPVVTPA